MFNSFSLGEHEPSSYYLSTSGGGSGNAANLQQQQQRQRQQRHHKHQQHQQQQEVEGREDFFFSGASGITAAEHDPSYDDFGINDNNLDSHDEALLPAADDPYHYHRQQQYCFDDTGEDAGADAAEFCTAAAAVSAAAAAAGHHYYPGRGRNAVENLAQSQDFGGRSSYSSHKNNKATATSRFPHRYQPYLFSGRSPYGSSSGGGISTVAGRIRRRQRQRRRRASGLKTAASSRFPRTLPPAVAAAAAAGAAALVKIMAATGLALAVLAPLAAALSSHWAYFVAGGICAAISHTAAVPLDVIKTRIQVCCGVMSTYWRSHILWFT